MPFWGSCPQSTIDWGGFGPIWELQGGEMEGGIAGASRADRSDGSGPPGERTPLTFGPKPAAEVHGGRKDSSGRRTRTAAFLDGFESRPQGANRSSKPSRTGGLSGIKPGKREKKYRYALAIRFGAAIRVIRFGFDGATPGRRHGQPPPDSTPPKRRKAAGLSRRPFDLGSTAFRAACRFAPTRFARGGGGSRFVGEVRGMRFHEPSMNSNGRRFPFRRFLNLRIP